ncbi:MAG: hypothetical protein RL338_1874 [Chloroflexota bacterium]|jgi:DNA-binding response OmpR family regulator
MDGPGGAGRVLVVADDLIWSTRLAALVRGAGREPLVVAAGALPAPLPAVDAAIVDLTARRGDPLEQVRRVAAGGTPVLCVGQHDDVATRKAALAAGATRVLAYRKLAEDGPAVVGAFLAKKEVVTG